MADGPENIEFVLRKVDRSKHFILTTIVALFIVVLFTFGFLLAHARVNADTGAKLLFAATGAQMAFVGICAVLVSYHVTRMTRAVLNAIDLASKK
jgi:hypothetical protein